MKERQREKTSERKRGKGKEVCLLGLKTLALPAGLEK